jgi:hypothetical protein
MKSFYEFYRQVREDTIGQKDPIPLSQINAQTAKAAMDSGQKDGNPQDDMVQVGKFDGAATSLKPSQKEIILVKAFNMALNSTVCGGKFPPGGELGSIVSDDDFIMDGHHRWAQTLLVAPSATIQAAQIPLPGQKVVSLLNVYTAGKPGGGTKGNPGTGEISEFTGDNIQKMIIDVAEKTGKSPDHPDVPGFTLDDLKARLAKLGNGDYNAGLATIKQNADALPKALPGWAPSRIDMPIVTKEEIPDLIKKLEAGSLDHENPYSPEVQQTMGGAKPAGAPAAPGAPAAAPGAPGAPAAPAAPAAPGAPQQAWSTNDGPTVMEQVLILSGIVTTEDVENSRKKRRR